MVVVCGGLVQISECLPTIFTKPLLSFCDRERREGRRMEEGKISNANFGTAQHNSTENHRQCMRMHGLGRLIRLLHQSRSSREIYHLTPPQLSKSYDTK